MLALNLNAHLIAFMSNNTLAHFVMKMNIHQIITVCCVKKTDGESNRAAQDMLCKEKLNTNK